MSHLHQPRDLPSISKNHVTVASLETLITDMGEKSELTELNITPKNHMHSSRVIIDRFQITARGAFSQVIYFHYLLRRSPFLFTLPNWQWTQSKNNDIAVNATVEVYHY